LAATLGVEDGDVLLQVGDKEVGSAIDVREGLVGVTAGEKLTVRVNRRGVEKTLEATKPTPSKAKRRLEKRDPLDASETGKKEIR
jgi:S1-C subfamily serine protease